MGQKSKKDSRGVIMLVNKLLLSLILVTFINLSQSLTFTAQAGDFLLSAESANGRPPSAFHCGDGVCDTESGEECDEGMNNGPPPSNCSDDCKHNNVNQGGNNVEAELIE